ncbi:copper chaperone PCu(A)C [Devosia sp.]|uniref:copper chaperone PCu(A)C n=1 Tax=Devosia sp. TaxID=1871048 RepID=UPI001B1063BA|nr:copper chaperone PCu(A)C [Devosia sp.]MBO9588796.1 copper chaperone PCu(A)C [Devosia sp.]
MQKIIATLFLASLATFGSVQLSSAHGFKGGEIFIDHPMIQEAPPGARVLGGYVTLQNNGAEDDRLIAIESPAAEKVDLHQSVVTDGIARMTPLSEGLPLPAGQIVWLGDNGTHAMFVQPDRRYAVGDELPATLIFEKAGRVEVTFKVEERSTELAPGHGDHGQ